MKRFVSVFLAIMMTVSCFAFAAYASRDISAEETLASELKSLGLFKGVSDTDFALGRAPSRVEAVIMLIRVLGKESDAVEKTWSHPFTDVPTWADNYVGYAYENGLTKGSSAMLFGTGNANAAMYVTFVLRALGYSDSDGDFTWSDPFTLAEKIGILPESVDKDNFLRADVAAISHAALSAKLKDSDLTLAKKLIAAGVFTEESYGKSCSHAEEPQKPLTELTAEQVYRDCSPAVFYIEVYDEAGNATSTGSGFFIDGNGTAVTNYHVIDEAHSAKVQMSDGTKYDILGVYDCSSVEDWAVIKVDCEGNPYLGIGAEEMVVGASTVYAIGSPKGLQNTITTGIISNPSRDEGGLKYIQTSAAISAGSSGGALINKYGQVIGITSGSYIGGQNLNIALPVSYTEGYRTSAFTDLATFSKADIQYTVSPNRIELYEGGECYISLNFSCTGFPESFKDYDIILGCTNPEIAKVELTNEDKTAIPVNAKIVGLSQGTTTLLVRNNRNKKTHNIRVDVRASDFVSYTRETARDYLKKWIMENGKVKEDGSYSHGFTYTDAENMKIWYVSLDYSEEKDALNISGMKYISSTQYFFGTLEIPLNSALKFTCLVMENGSMVRGGYGLIDRSGFRKDTTLKYDYYKGENSDKKEFNELSTSGIHKIFEMFGEYLDKHIGSISLDDFGFSAYEN